jgi:transcriptional regulator with XRE-family HTH domain
MVLGAQLRRLREARGITRAAAGWAIRGSESKISRLELGRVRFKERDIADLLDLYGVTDEQQRMTCLDLVRQANTPGWQHSYGDVLPDWAEPYLALEEAACRIRALATQFVPSLLQTQDYARAVTLLRHPELPDLELQRHVDLQMTRRQLLTAEQPPELWLVVDEAVLLRPPGGDTRILRRQLEHMIELAALPGVRIQILPLRTGGSAVVSGSFTLLRFNEPDLPDVVYLEHLTGAVYLDKRDDIDHYLRVMNAVLAQADPFTTAAATLTKIVGEL